MTDTQERQPDFHEFIYARNLNLTQIAKKAGLNNIVMLSHWQQGDVRYPRRQSVRLVAKAIGVTVDELYDVIEESWRRVHENPPDAKIAA